MEKLLRVKQRLMRALRAKPEELPQTAPRKETNWPSTMDPLFRHLRRHCDSTEAAADSSERLPLKAPRRIEVKVIEQAPGEETSAS